jgi:hypothetical protein
MQTQEAIDAVRKANTSSDNALQIKKNIDENVPPAKVPPGTGSILMVRIYNFFPLKIPRNVKKASRSFINGLPKPVLQFLNA